MGGFCVVPARISAPAVVQTVRGNAADKARTPHRGGAGSTYNKTGIDHQEIEELLYKKYETETREDIVLRKKESDIVTNRMTELLSLKGKVSLTSEYLKEIHKYLFKGIYDHAGKFRKCNIFKEEPVLNGETVKYSNFFALEETLRYDMSEEKNKNYLDMSKSEIINSIADCTSGIWQAHPFMEIRGRQHCL